VQTQLSCGSAVYKLLKDTSSSQNSSLILEAKRPASVIA
jgi:hypothetical protein